MPTLHILSSPHNPVHPSNRVDPFSMIVFKYIKHMTILGWNCIHYGVQGASVECEMVTCLTDRQLDYDNKVLEYNRNAAVEIQKRKNSGDFILCFYGNENKGAADFNNDLTVIEPSIGYRAEAVFAPKRIFVSYAQMHYFYGKMNMLMNPSWWDDVIFNPITASEFEYNENKEDYFLYFGRVVEEKGLNIAIQATEAAKKKLIIAGPGNLSDLGYKEIPKHVECVGVCDVEQRKKLMSKAKAILGPTYYIEPFGNMIPEGYMSGTPAITTDWGGFTDSVIQGVTGFRCREFREFVSALINIESIDPRDCKKWAMENCEDSVVHVKHDYYLKKIQQENFYR